MNEREFCDLLLGFFESDEAADFFETEPGAGVDRVRSFEESGLLTSDAGLVVRMSDGSEFQVTVRRSR